MRYMTTVLDKNSPIQQRSEPSEDLRAIISRAFLMAQNAANMGGSVAVDVWEESGDASKNPWAKIGTVSVNFARVPSLLLRAPLEATTATLALGNGKPTAGAPARVACPYCDSVMDLREDVGPGIRYDYTCAVCQWEASYSPSQAAEWIRKFPIRSDGGRLAAPTFGDFDKPQKVTALASYRSGQNLALLVHIVKPYGESLKVYSGKDGKEMGDGIRCRKPRDRGMALSLAKRFIEDKQDVEIHDAFLHTVEPMDLWATPPATKTTIQELKEIIDGRRGYCVIQTVSGKTIETNSVNISADGTRVESYNIKTPLPLDEVARLQANAPPDEYGGHFNLVLYQKPGWDPDAKPEKKAGKGKKAAAPAAPAVSDELSWSQRIGALEEWQEIFIADESANDTADELNDKTNDRMNALYSLIEGQTVPDGVPADDEDLLGAWRALYPERALGETVRSMQPEAVAA